MPTLIRPQSNQPETLRQALALILDQIEVAEPWREVGATGNPAFQNSWANFGGSSISAAFRKNVLGQVEFRGRVTSPAGGGTGNGTVAFTLPEGYRPTAMQQLTQIGSSGLANPVVGVAEIAADGTVLLFLSGVAANAVVTSINLAGVIRP